jgi:HK97 family phage major capsid protein/HK97 family phage prohead protease
MKSNTIHTRNYTAGTNTRSHDIGYSIRAGSAPLTLTGTAIVFNQPANIGGVREVIVPGALRGADLSDICLILNHNTASVPLARTPNTLNLNLTENGLDMRALLPDTEQGRAVYQAVQRGDLTKMSFAFDIRESQFDPHTQTRTITAIGKVYEISIVNFAAYNQTSVQARNGAESEVNNMSNQFNNTGLNAAQNNAANAAQGVPASTPVINPVQNQTGIQVRTGVDNVQFNPVTGAVFNTGNNPAPANTIETPEYRSAFFKSLLGQELNEAETRAYNAAKVEKRADAFNTLTSSAAVVPSQTLNEVVTTARPQGGLWNEVRHFNVPANLAIPVGTPSDPAAWHDEGLLVERREAVTHNVVFSAFELIKVLSMSAAAKRMSIAAFESYITQELSRSVTDAINTAIVNGSGVGQPQGLLSGISWNMANSFTTAANNVVDGILQVIALLPAGYANGAKFAMSNATLFSRIYPAKDANGALIIVQDAQAGNVRRLFGFEIVIDDNIPADTVLFGNFQYYGVNIPEGIAVEASRESGFANGLIDYRALTIADGKPIIPEAFVMLTIG